MTTSERSEKMTCLTVTVPAWMKVFLEHVVADGTYPTVDDCLSTLIGQFHAQWHDEKFEEFLMTGFPEGKPDGLSDEEWTRRRAAYRAKRMEWLEKELLKGLDSGPPKVMTADDWAALKRQVLERRQCLCETESSKTGNQ